MIELVISGGQTGGDQAGWIAAEKYGIPTGGFMPKGFKTEAGCRPDFASRYGAAEHHSPEYPPRTRANAERGDMTLFFYSGARRDSAGMECTRKACAFYGKPFIPIDIDFGPDQISAVGRIVAAQIRDSCARTINVAGNRASSCPGIEAAAVSFLSRLFVTLGHTRVPMPRRITSS